MASGTSDYYQLLGVARTASTDEIRKAYRKLAKQLHPDANLGDPGAADRFKAVGEAYATLSDPARREQYDLSQSAGSFGFGGGAGGGGFAGGEGFQDLSGMGGFGDILSSLFDRGGPGGHAGTARRPQRGADQEFELEISLEKAVRGEAVTVRLPLAEECGECAGSGAGKGAPVRCPECGGAGSISFGQGARLVTRPCPRCRGAGTVPPSCTHCGGSGQVRRSQEIRIQVPPGSETGDRIRLTGKGEPGERGAPAGNLNLRLKVLSHPVYRREGLDIHQTVGVNVAQAVLGTTVPVETVDGTRIQLRIPPGTQPGARLRLRGRGVQRKGETGDHLVEVKVSLPDTLSPEERDAFERFAREAGLLE